MTTPSVTAKEFSNSHGDRLIRVLAENHKGNGFHALTFPESEIQGVAEMGQDCSALVLRSGTEIPVALPYEQLERKIYEPDFKNDGRVLDLRAVTGEAAKLNAANTNEAPAEPKVGEKMPGGTVYAGRSPETKAPMYTTPSDACMRLTFNDAQEYAARIGAHGYKDWHVPTKPELNVLFNNRAAIGGFDMIGSAPAGWYWSSSFIDKWGAWGQRFDDGDQFYHGKVSPAAVRLVR